MVCVHRVMRMVMTDLRLCKHFLVHIYYIDGWQCLMSHTMIVCILWRVGIALLLNHSVLTKWHVHFSNLHNLALN